MTLNYVVIYHQPQFVNGEENIVNWVTTADRYVHTADTTQLDFAVGKFVQTCRDCRQLGLVANSVCTANATQLGS